MIIGYCSVNKVETFALKPQNGSAYITTQQQAASENSAVRRSNSFVEDLFLRRTTSLIKAPDNLTFDD